MHTKELGPRLSGSRTPPASVSLVPLSDPAFRDLLADDRVQHEGAHCMSEAQLPLGMAKSPRHRIVGGSAVNLVIEASCPCRSLLTLNYTRLLNKNLHHHHYDMASLLAKLAAPVQPPVSKRSSVLSKPTSLPDIRPLTRSLVWHEV